MAKIYDQKHESGRTEYREPVQAQKRGMAILVGIILALLVIFMLYQMARGEDAYLTAALLNDPVASTIFMNDAAIG